MRKVDSKENVWNNKDSGRMNESSLNEEKQNNVNANASVFIVFPIRARLLASKTVDNSYKRTQVSGIHQTKHIK